MSKLEIRSVEKSYGEFLALNGVSFSAEAGEFVVMVGPSGCGKSTLLRAIAGLEDVSSGDIVIGGRDVTMADPAQRGIAMVFQNYALYPHMTVRQNMAFSLSLKRTPADQIEAAVQRAARILRIEEQLDKHPKALSGGQKQRVAIGRAITRSPEVFLFDEPLSNLDAALRSQMRIELGRLHAELGATMVYVTHDQTEAMTMADKIVVMRAGNIEQVGAPLDLYNEPATRFVAGFLGSPRMNFVAATVGEAASALQLHVEGTSDVLEFGLERLARRPAPGAKVLIGVRPEAISAEAEGCFSLPGQVAIVESLGRETLLYVDCGAVRTVDSESHEGYVAVQQNRQIRLAIGEAFQVHLNPERLYLFDDQDRTILYPTQYGTD